VCPPSTTYHIARILLIAFSTGGLSDDDRGQVRLGCSAPGALCDTGANLGFPPTEVGVHWTICICLETAGGAFRMRGFALPAHGAGSAHAGAVPHANMTLVGGLLEDVRGKN
jgi:hypothetical protein